MNYKNIPKKFSNLLVRDDSAFILISDGDIFKLGASNVEKEKEGDGRKEL